MIPTSSTFPLLNKHLIVITQPTVSRSLRGVKYSAPAQEKGRILSDSPRKNEPTIETSTDYGWHRPQASSVGHVADDGHVHGPPYGYANDLKESTTLATSVILTR